MRPASGYRSAGALAIAVLRIADELGRSVGPQQLDGRVLARLHAPQRLERRRAR